MPHRGTPAGGPGFAAGGGYPARSPSLPGCRHDWIPDAVSDHAGESEIDLDFKDAETAVNLAIRVRDATIHTENVEPQ